MRYLLDTNILSEPLRSRPDPLVVERLAAANGELAVASVVVHELIFGLERLGRSKRRRRLARYIDDVVLATIPVLAYDTEAAVWHGRERARLSLLGRTPPFADGQIAAIAVTNGLVLVTRNVTDFESFKGLTVERWHGG